MRSACSPATTALLLAQVRSFDSFTPLVMSRMHRPPFRRSQAPLSEGYKTCPQFWTPKAKLPYPMCPLLATAMRTSALPRASGLAAQAPRLHARRQPA